MNIDEPVVHPRQRLSEIRTLRHLLPFVRATSIEDTSVYWLPVSGFPIAFRQRAWILRFIELLSEELKKDKQTVETFLQLKYTRTELNERFVNTMMDYRPMTGLLLAPGGSLPHHLTPMEAKRLSENPGPDATINIDYLAPDYTAWFASQQDEEQRKDFFGIGGMLLLWIDQGGEIEPPRFDLPNVIRSHPAMKNVDFEGQMRRGMRLQHPFLRRSREIFTAHLPDSIVKRHSLFVLPLFRSHHFVDATAEQRKTWFEVFSGYCVESPQDKGILFAFRDGNFDERLIALVEATRNDLQEYPA